VIPANPPDDAVDRRNTYRVLDSHTRYDGQKWLVRTDTVALPGGSVQRDLLVHPGAVGIVCLDEDERMLLLQQYRHPAEATLWEPPAGLLDEPGEDLLAAAKRELYEETHCRAADWRVLVDAFSTPGSSSELLRVYLARGISGIDDIERYQGEHEEVDMPLTWVPLDEVVRRVLDGRLHNPMTVMGALAAYAARADGFEALRPADAPRF